MGIQKCENCGYQFTWKEIQKVSCWSYKPLICSECGEKHNITKQTRVKLGLSTALILVFLFFYASDDSFSLEILLPIIVILLFPYFAKFNTNKINR
ncbi:MAG: hypothetical protein K0R18_1556 [Bacillales bacterium]|nr:hypothetical protein [Bacillales bacterium]